MDYIIETTPYVHHKSRNVLLCELNIDNCGPILTVSEATQVLKVSETTVYSLIRAKRINAVKITGKLYRISRESLKEFLHIA